MKVNQECTNGDYYLASFFSERNDGVPKCGDCLTGVVRPDVVFFGENLPSRFWELSSKDFEECDLLMVTYLTYPLGHWSIVDKSSACNAKGPRFKTRWRKKIYLCHCVFKCSVKGS